MRKTRPEAKLLNLPEAQQAQLAEWLLGGMPYHLAAERVEKEFGVMAGKNSFSGFWTAVCGPLLLSRRARAASTATLIGDAAAAEPDRFDAATIDAIKQRAFELAIAPGTDPKAVKDLFGLVLQARAQELSAAELRLQREKFEFDAAKACLKKLPELKVIADDRGLDSDAKLAAARQALFGVIPA